MSRSIPQEVDRLHRLVAVSRLRNPPLAPPILMLFVISSSSLITSFQSSTTSAQGRQTLGPASSAAPQAERDSVRKARSRPSIRSSLLLLVTYPLANTSMRKSVSRQVAESSFRPLSVRVEVGCVGHGIDVGGKARVGIRVVGDVCLRARHLDTRYRKARGSPYRNTTGFEGCVVP